MTSESIATALSGCWQFDGESRLNIEITPGGSFRATEVRPDSSTGLKLVGYVDPRGGVFSAEDPDLTLSQAKIWEPIMLRYCDRIQEAEASGKTRLRLFTDGDFPELFNPIDERENLPANVKSGLFPVYQALERMLTLRGYTEILRKTGDEPWEIWAVRRGTENRRPMWDD